MEPPGGAIAHSSTIFAHMELQNPTELQQADESNAFLPQMVVLQRLVNAHAAEAGSARPRLHDEEPGGDVYKLGKIYK
jgi:hypothetical protein